MAIAFASAVVAVQPGRAELPEPGGLVATSLSTGGHHSCALDARGTAWCWGANDRGQLGTGTSWGSSRYGLPWGSSRPLAVEGVPDPIVAISAGDVGLCFRNPDTVTPPCPPDPGLAAHTCAVTEPGAVWCWGANDNGELGADPHAQLEGLAQVSGLPGPATAVSVGADHSCALTGTGEVWCWGSTGNGQLGDGTEYQPTVGPREGNEPYKWSPVQVIGLPDPIIALSAGWLHNCAIAEGGAVWCWGSGTTGQLGDGGYHDSAVPLRVVGMPVAAVQIASGSSHTCAGTIEGQAWCWGSNEYDQLGRLTPGSPGGPAVVVFPEPTPLPASSAVPSVETLSAGNRHTCAISEAGEAWCWGGNEDGQVGNGDYAFRSPPDRVTGLPGPVSAVSAGGWGGSHTCAIAAAGELWCWGSNQLNQLGEGTAARISATPVDVVLPESADALSVAERGGCAAEGPGPVYCWGAVTARASGAGFRSTPDPAIGLPQDISGVSVGSRACALTWSGEVWCWNDDEPPGSKVTGLPEPMVEVSSGRLVACAIAQTGGVWCWGQNGSGELGDGTTEERASPVAVIGLPGPAIAVSVGGVVPLSAHTCAVIQGGQVWCWGRNHSGQLGDGSTEARSTPVAVAGLSEPIARVSAGDAHTCALAESGAIWCWGGTGTGKLTDAWSEDPSPPVAAAGLPGPATDVSAGERHTCSVLLTGAVWCWGENRDGQLGDGTDQGEGVTCYSWPISECVENSWRATPRPVQDLALPNDAIAVGNEHSCALAADGSVRCWGSNRLGQLGDGWTPSSPVPIRVVAPLPEPSIFLQAAAGALTLALLRRRTVGRGRAGSRTSRHH